MLHTIKLCFVRYREQWSYLVVGGCTTVVNYVIYFLLNYLGQHYMLSNALAWVGAVIFAYFANGKWVYRSTRRRGLAEAGAFVLSRLFSLGLESLLLFLMVDLASLDQNVSKLLVAVLVVIVNYLTGRLVYKRKKA